MKKWLKRAIVVGTLVVTTLVGVAVPTLAAPNGAFSVQDVPPLVESLAWLATGAGAVAAGLVIERLMERWTWFQQQLNAEQKWTVSAAISLVLSLGAKLALAYIPANVFAAVDPYWQIIGDAIAIWSASQAAHFWRVNRHQKQRMIIGQ